MLCATTFALARCFIKLLVELIVDNATIAYNQTKRVQYLSLLCLEFGGRILEKLRIRN